MNRELGKKFKIVLAFATSGFYAKLFVFEISPIHVT
jgi:hypothetical protein